MGRNIERVVTVLKTASFPAVTERPRSLPSASTTWQHPKSQLALPPQEGFSKNRGCHHRDTMEYLVQSCEGNVATSSGDDSHIWDKGPQCIQSRKFLHELP